MSEQSTERYIDPNSGAAPQPGGIAGPDGYAKGHGSAPAGYAITDDGLEPKLPETQEVDGKLDDFTETEMVDAKAMETQGMNAAEGVPDVESEGHDAEGGELDEYSEVEAVDAKSLETQGIDPSQGPEGLQGDDAEESDDDTADDTESAESADSNDSSNGSGEQYPGYGYGDSQS